MRNQYGGRRTARNPEQADVWGRVRADRFDLPADPPAVKLSETELAQEAYAAMGSETADQLMGFLVSTIRPDTARSGKGRSGLTGCLWSDTLAAEAAEYLGHSISIRQVNGALLAAGYLPVSKTSRRAVWAVGATRKDG